MKKIKELRVMSMSDLRSLCIKHDWFTEGTNEEYDKFLNMTKSRGLQPNANMTANRLLDMALMIQQYSDPDTYEVLGLEGIVYCLCEICHSCFTVTDE